MERYPIAEVNITTIIIYMGLLIEIKSIANMVMPEESKKNLF
jgi:hypothetical protein